MSILTAVRSPAIDVDITHPRHKADPFPLYRRLREEAPVCEVAMPDGQTAWLVTRYDDVAAVLKDDRFSKDRFRTLSREQMKRQPWIPGVFKPLFRNMLDVDAPDHTRLRALVQKAFTPRRVDEMEPRIRLLADELLGAVKGGRMDLIRDFALPLPATVIAEMLGVPAKDRHRFHRWSNTIVSLNWSTWDLIKGIPAVWRFLRYIRKLVRLRRAEPADDLITALVQAEEQGEKLNEDELVAMIFLLLVAGHETTVNLIGNGTLALLQNADQWERLRCEPALIKPAVEELLRYASPLDTATERYAREDVTLAGVTIPQGSLVYAGIASANRDETQFHDADALDVARDPNRHLSFGLGIHFCLGAPLARIEGQIAFNALLQHTRQMHLAVPAESLKWRRGVVLRGMASLPVEFERGR
jgi:cytochrome P450